MKNISGKKIALIMVLALVLTPVFWLQGETIAMAAAPAFKETKVEIVGGDETYQLDIKNKVEGSKYKWSSTNTKVARVSSAGIVTSVGKGSAKIRCIITYPNKKTKTITSNITVVIPATKVSINNATEVNGAHILKLGETYNFNRDIVPSNSSDKTYWSLGGGDLGCVQITNSSSGIVKANKVGKVILVATAAKTATEADAAKSVINDAIIIEVVAPTASVGYAEIVGSTEIKVVFDSPIDERSVIGPKNTLLDSIIISLKKNIKGVMASDPGNITAQLSSDKMTLIITSTNRFEGEYGISFSNKIKTVDGVAIKDYSKQISYVDNVPPEVISVSMDDSGVVDTILFNEAINFSDFKVHNAGILPGSSTTAIDPKTKSILENENNYIPSEDKKSLSINLSNIAYTDFNKILTVTFSGIKDMSGNTPKNYTMPVVLQTDNTPKSQAKLIKVERTAYNNLTATFDRSISFAGYASINNGSLMMGTIDEKNQKLVHYTINEADSKRTGTQIVSISSWQGYNVDPKDTTSYIPQKMSVGFDVDTTSPNLITYEFDPETSVLSLIYNKEVILSSNTGIFNADLVTITDDIRPNNNIAYVRIASENPKEIKLQMSNMTLFGKYTFTMDQFFVSDSFKNYSIPRTITVNYSAGANVELPGPYMIHQSKTNLGQVYLEFSNKLDVASAQDIRNYSISGVIIKSARVEMNTKTGATVVLTVEDGSIDITLERQLKISDVKSYEGTPIAESTNVILLNENKRPSYMEPPVFNKGKDITLNFSENITGSMVVKVTQMGSYVYEIDNVVTVSGTNVIITLSSSPINNSHLKIDIIANKIADSNGNQSAPMNTQIFVPIIY